MMDIVTSIEMARKKKSYYASIAFMTGSITTLSPYLNKLHLEEVNCYNSFKHERRKLSYLLGRLSAKAALLEMDENVESSLIWIDSGVFQFPVVKCTGLPNVQVSITHSNNIALCIAFPEEHPMGIDIEKINKKKETNLLNQCTPKEVMLLKALSMNNINGYTAIWSIKEALSKILKTGMMISFRLLEIENFTIINGILESKFKYFKQYKVSTFFLASHAISIASPKFSNINFQKTQNLIKASLSIKMQS